MQNVLEGANQKINLSVSETRVSVQHKSFVYLIKIAIEAETLHYNVLTLKCIINHKLGPI